jgi:hypothetical protein
MQASPVAEGTVEDRAEFWGGMIPDLAPVPNHLRPVTHALVLIVGLLIGMVRREGDPDRQTCTWRRHW